MTMIVQYINFILFYVTNHSFLVASIREILFFSTFAGWNLEHSKRLCQRCQGF